MEENHQDLTKLFDSPEVQKNETGIAMSSMEENIRKLYEASRIGSIQILKTLIEDDPDLIQKVAIICTSNNIESPLHVSVSNGHHEFTPLLLDHNPELAAEVDAYQQTPLHLASKNEDMESIKALLEKKKSAILDLSLMLRQIEMVGYLLSIPEVKTGTSIAKFAASNGTKGSPKSQKITRNSKRRKQESAAAKKARGRWKIWRKNLKYKGDWVQEVQGTMMLVATVIATVTFQAGTNPPGGVCQQATPNYSPNSIIGLCPAGTAIMSCTDPETFSLYLMANTVSFLTSASVILLIISGLPLKNRVCSWVLALAMCTAVVFFAFGYLWGSIMVSLLGLSLNNGNAIGYRTAVFFWLVMVGMVGLFHIIRFLVWVLKTLFRTFASILSKAHPPLLLPLEGSERHLPEFENVRSSFQHRVIPPDIERVDVI